MLSSVNYITDKLCVSWEGFVCVNDVRSVDQCPFVLLTVQVSIVYLPW